MKVNKLIKPHVSVGVVATMLGVSHGAVLAMIRRGEITATKIGKWNRIPMAEYRRLEREHNLGERAA